MSDHQERIKHLRNSNDLLYQKCIEESSIAYSTREQLSIFYSQHVLESLICEIKTKKVKSNVFSNCNSMNIEADNGRKL